MTNEDGELLGYKVNCWTCKARTPHEKIRFDAKWRCRGCGACREISPEVIAHAVPVTLKPQAAVQFKKLKRPRGYGRP